MRVKGDIIFKTCLPLGVVMDERICSGHYFASAFQYIKNYLSHPTLLEKTLEEELAEKKAAEEAKNGAREERGEFRESAGAEEAKSVQSN